LEVIVIDGKPFTKGMGKEIRQMSHHFESVLRGGGMERVPF
jgi:hypothetical protein